MTDKNIVDEITKEALRIFHIANDNKTDGKQYEAVKRIVKGIVSETLKRVFEEIENNLTDELEYPQKEFAYLLHKRGWLDLKKKFMGE